MSTVDFIPFSKLVAQREAALRKIISDKDAQIAALRAQLKASLNRGRDAR